MDSGRGAVVRLIEKATDSTDREVDQRLLKAIKSTVRSSDDELRAAVEALMSKMKKEHSQVRYLAVLIIDELFMRSKLFRSLFINSFDQFLSLSVGFRRNMPLPPPANIASILRSKSLELLEKWHGSFGVHYRQLRLSLDYLKNTLRYQFPNRLGNAERLQQERREREIRSREILQNKYENCRKIFPPSRLKYSLRLTRIGLCSSSSTAQEQEEVDMWEEGKIEANDPVNASSLAATSSNSIDLQDTKVCVGRDTSVDTPVDLGHSDDVPSAEDASPNVSQSCTDSESPRSRLLAEAPVLKWGPFLESWGSTQDAMVNYRGLELESHWGRVEQDAIIPGERIAELSAHWSLYQEQAAEIRPNLKMEKIKWTTIAETTHENPTEGAPLMNESKEKLSHSGDQLMKRLAEKAIRNVRGRDRESKSLKRAKLAKVREHNEAVLREAACSSTSLTSAAFAEKE
ncbi:unnamed protein product [Spirodela intermedia]|uniref:Uncharacterized protein n=1 Tax=Spirodela intermedia TaxID=51605 RepID=A0A7I8J8H8_SPIIN|nr:unnamed protein product [Spirodela intermedia]CAA6665742.1 unnamed protein product [Spirodela intermedia]